jgi:hypothetical protein
LQGRYFKGIVIPVNSSLHPSKDLPVVFSFFQNQLAVPSARKFYSMPSAIKILLIIPYGFFFGENLYRYKNILLKSSNNIFAIPSGHGIEAPAALSCSLHRLFVKLVFQNVFRGKTI